MQESDEIVDMKPKLSDFREEAVLGLLSVPKNISPKFFYDDEGSRIFDEITQLPEYYLTRAELEILETRRNDIGRAIGEDATVVELGSGNGKKGLMLLKGFIRPRELIFVDISIEALRNAVKLVHTYFPYIAVKGICADYTSTDVMGQMNIPGRKGIVFLGSTIGNMEPEEAKGFISGCRKLLSEGETLTIGVDLKKDKETLERAYNDSKGVTARFNLNLISRINRELGAGIPGDAFVHRAFYNESRGRIEMHLQSTKKQTFYIAGNKINFEKGETIHTENSYKYSIDEFSGMLRDSGFNQIEFWQDSEQRYALFTAAVR